MTIQYVEPWTKFDCEYEKGELPIWSFTLEASIGRVDVGCCWLLLIADGCYWLQLVAAGCWMIAGCGWDTAGCCWLLDDWCWLLDDCWLWLGYCWLLLVTGWSLLVAGVLLACEKDFEYFRDKNDLQLRQICRQKTPWIFPGYWWFAAKTHLKAKNSLNFSRILMICG